MKLDRKHNATPRKADNKGQAATVLERPAALGWMTSDDDERALRRWRGQTDIVAVTALEPDRSFFGTFSAESASGATYEVEIRSLAKASNSCGCIDHRVNWLGTCKHIEGTLATLRRGRARLFDTAAEAGSPRAEVFLDRRGEAVPRLALPGRSEAELAPALAFLAPFRREDGALSVEPETIEALLAAWAQAGADVRQKLRVSRHFGPWLDRHARARRRSGARTAFLAEVEAGRAEIDVLRHKLLPYQREGALHLAFGERALLADDMGLGKTVQAIAACELLARLKGIGRVLVVCPASLKAEWEEQIARFSGRPVRLVYGNRHERLSAYRAPEFFTIVNYEQVLIDAGELNTILRADVVVLDEAQRIKNWHTKTARCVKSITAPHAFVLTGTPIENRIDELYSIVQYLDPEILGPLFRFNRDFYELDERGRPANYKNLAGLRQRVQPVMLRRRKADVESQLPGRSVKTYFVAMAEEQIRRYADYHQPAAQLLAVAQRRPLTPKEFERLQQLLACMRMICDTPAILDPTCRISPKLEELEKILEDLLQDPDRKIIIFSEWERMLELVRELAAEMGLEVAWHTGSVPQQRRRAEINRFKQDPRCRLFLSTDSGSVGLNLQAASAVINMDLPWNPAKLEQRIARAWRKNQMRSVTVVNLVAEGTIEHNILHLLAQKQALADGVLDGQGDIAALQMPSGRATFIERMQAMMAPRVAQLRVVSPLEVAADALRQRHGERTLLIEACTGRDGRERLLVVLDLDEAALAQERERLAGEAREGTPPIELLSKAAWLTLRQLTAKGLVHFADTAARTLHRDAALVEPLAEPPLAESVSRLRAEAERAIRMAQVLAEGGFPEEALTHLAKALARGVEACLAQRQEPPLTGAEGEIRRLAENGVVPKAAAVLDAGLRAGDEIGSLLDVGKRLLTALDGADQRVHSADTRREMFSVPMAAE